MWRLNVDANLDVSTRMGGAMKEWIQSQNRSEELCAGETSGTMRFVKVHRYGVRTNPTGTQRLALEAPGKPTLEIATPPDFEDGIDGVWGPEELLIGSLATSFELTALAIAEQGGVPVHSIQTDATGHVQSKDGRLRIALFELDVTLETDACCEPRAESVAHLAKDRCVVAGALDVPIHLTVAAHAPRGDLALV
jgi:organic hydroperoxide reductase OsmC/OhrA